MIARRLILVYSLVLLAGLIAASQWVAYRLDYHPALGGMRIGNHLIYPPWAIFIWARQFGPDIPNTLNEGYAFIGGAFVLATLALVAARQLRRHIPVREIGKDRWASKRDMKRAGLLTGNGTVLGQAFGRYLTYDGPEHQLVSGASRSGKGVGHVIPTLLNWNGSILAYDVKNELWDVTAGLRSKRGYCLFFNPTRPDSARFNPLFEIRKGDNEVRDTQNIVEMLVNPTGAKHTMDIWDQQACQFLVALILHVLYAEPGPYKNLATVRARLLDFKRTVQAMVTTPHRFNPQTGVPEVHPEVALVANELRRQPAKFQSSVCGTAAGYLTLWGDNIIARNTATSDFRLSDLVCADRPMTLYLQPPPSDAPRLRPLVRLVINQACRALMEYLDRDNSGRPKNHRLLLSLDEFPTLGRLDFFTMNLRQMAGYGIKAHLIVQSFNDIIEQYGMNNTILDNCHILATFAAADTVTCQRISQMVGTVTEYRESYSEPGRNLGARTISHSEHVRPLLSPGDIRELPVDDQLLFVTGYKPMRVKKVRYYNEATFMKRVLPAPDQSLYLNVPTKFKIDWLRERAKGPELPMPAPSNDELLFNGRPPSDSDDDLEEEAPDQGPPPKIEFQ
ncbi:MAG: type IV secretory system conjugative DNA transfer family protein [Tepidisphaeraceae bacterium]